MSQPQGFVDLDNPSYVYKLRKSIYGLKQAPRAWYTELHKFLLASGFQNSLADTSLFILKHGGHLIYLLVYVDDIIITGDNDGFVQQFVTLLSQQFSLKDLGQLSYFLGVEVISHLHGLLLSQRRYILDLLARTNMMEAKPVLTPLPTSPPITLHTGSPLRDPSEYRAIVGSLQYLLLTRPDIAFAVNKLSQFMHKPTSDHWLLVKRLLRYLCGSVNEGILLYRDSPQSLHAFSDAQLHAFSDADWAGNKYDFTSTSANIVYLG